MQLPAFLSTDLLTIYLNDHLSGATAGHELGRRTLAANRGSEFETRLATLAGDIGEDKRELELIMERLDVPADPIKRSAAWLVEKAGRLKLNGQIVGYSPLSRLLEIEGLVAGVHAKLGLWRALRAAAAADVRLEAERLDRLAARAESQLETLAEIQVRAAELALTPSARAA